jgi:hypothetical protein
VPESDCRIANTDKILLGVFPAPASAIFAKLNQERGATHLNHDDLPSVLRA